MIRFVPLVAFALALTACAPQSAELIDATMIGWLNEDTSFTLYQGLFDPEDADENWRIDCRQLDAVDEPLRLSDTLGVCDPAEDDYQFANGETWLNGQAWHGFTLALDDAWRGEGVFTHEGDLQVGFHHKLPGGEDFRFMFAIDPDFSPMKCEGTTGNVRAVPVDGTPWLEAWADVWSDLGQQSDLPPFLASATADFPDGQLYLLNARAYQLDVGNLDNPNIYVWGLPEEWMGGFARGTFSAEDMHSRPTRFGTPSVYLETDGENFVTLERDEIWYGDCQIDGGTTADCPRFEDFREQAIEYATRAQRNLSRAMPQGLTADYRPIHIDNAWRPTDDVPGGLDGWNELNYSWVVLSSDSDPSVGGEVEGAFSILMDPDDSNSRFIVQGRFSIPKVKRERWAGPDLYNEKLEEAGVELCIR